MENYTKTLTIVYLFVHILNDPFQTFPMEEKSTYKYSVHYYLVYSEIYHKTVLLKL